MPCKPLQPVKATIPEHPKVKDVDNMEKFVSVALHGVVCNNVNVISQKA
jgi:hypothetical protein